MSGICAVWHKDDPARVASTLTAMSAALPPRQADRPARETASGVGVAVRARVDGEQIFRNQRVLLVCDADLLNESELARTVGASMERPGTGALLGALYERYGDGFVQKLRGGFAVVLWDFLERRLVAAIDGFGIKRLAWHDDGRTLLIASRVDAIRAGGGGAGINPRAIANLLNFSANLAPDTIFTGIERLPPGTMLTAAERQTRTAVYWDMRYDLSRGASEDSLARDLESVMERSVADHCGGELASECGAFLSGGTDSSTVVGLMTRAAGAPVKAFSIGFQEQGFDELGYARVAARAFASNHHTYLVSAADCLDALGDIVRAFDEPFGNSSAIATYFCARLAAENGASCLLAGDGGDELFGGNERYATEQIFQAYHVIPERLRASVIEPLVALPLPTGLGRKARGYVRRARMGGVERMLSFQFLRTHRPADVFDGDFLQSLGDYDVVDVPSRHYTMAPAHAHLDRLLYVDMKITIGDNDLPKVTCMSELAGVRTRFPFLDRGVAEFSGRIPANLKVKRLQKRYLFKRAFRNLLPAQIIQKKKHGFGVPVALWMKSDPRLRELTHDTLLSPRAFGRGYFRRQFIEELFEKHASGDHTYYGDTLWTLVMLELWHQQVADEPVRVVA
jgi:asparagine synthase (glutamine-hydrolysing)